MARNVFGYFNPQSKEDREKDVRDIIYDRIVKMREGTFTYLGWKTLMEDNDAKNKCGVRFINEIKTKAKYIYHALTILLD